MQSMFRLASWGTESPGDKIMEKSALHKPKPMPVVEIPSFLKQIKRKRTDSPEPAPAHVVKKWKDAQGIDRPSTSAPDNMNPANFANGVVVQSPMELQQGPRIATADVLDARPKAQPVKREGASKSKAQKPTVKTEASSTDTPAPTMASSLSALQQSIEAQINYEILLKHNELRLIEQELAKCQVSLEQLRRCSLIPFPGTNGPSETLSMGVGAALQPQPGYTEPQYAAPWGVTDGPYTRHYAKWLISDVKFDSVSERALAQQAHGYFGMGEGRATRGSFAEFGATGKARTSRTSTGTLKLPALGENPAPAPKIDPLLHKRSDNGQWVRLYCAACAHSNFSNTQGFLNHCRIKHNQVFKSHDAAAIACGVPVDTSEGGNPVPATEPTNTPAATPTVSFPVSMNPGNVHPLVRSNPPELAKEVHRDFSTPRDAVKTAPPAKSNMTASASTPHLTALLQQCGFNGDLKGLVDISRSKVDLDVIETSDDDLADSALQTPVVAKQNQLARLPVSAPNAAPASKAPSARPGSKKGHSNGHARLPLTFSTHVSHGHNHHMPLSPVELSPHAVESNPGLVSDHDDDDDEDADDAHSQPDFILNDDIIVEDASDVEGVERTGSRQGLDSCCFTKGEGSRKH
jgi:ADA HAT complex component 1